MPRMNRRMGTLTRSAGWQAFSKHTPNCPNLPAIALQRSTIDVPAATIRRMRPILLIEDDANDAFLVRETLGQLNLVNDVITATSAEAARVSVRRSIPALIICDIHLGGESGIDFLNWLRDQPAPLGNVPVIMMSVSTDETHHMRASALRALLFMTKPINQDVLLDQLRGLGLFVTHIPQGEQAALMVEYRTH